MDETNRLIMQKYSKDAHYYYKTLTKINKLIATLITAFEGLENSLSDHKFVLFEAIIKLKEIEGDQ